MTDPRTIAEHGSRIIAALEHAWAAIRDTHPDVPDVVIVTGAGSNQKGTPEGYQLRGHHWPERWVLGGQDQPRAPELFVAGELLAAGGRAVVEVMLHEAAHALATKRGIKDTSAAGNRYHNKRFVALAAELGLRGPDVPDKITGWSHCTLHGQAACDAWAEVTAGIDAARLPFLVDLASPARPGGEDGGGDQGDDGPGKPAKLGGRRTPVECACHPQPRRLQLNAQADRRRPDHLRPVLRPVRATEDDQIASLTQARDDLGARAERAETGLDTARAQPAHPAAPSQTATGTASRS
jgi:hypothetical protein